MKMLLGVVAVRGAEPATHDSLLGDLTVQDDFDDAVKLHPALLKRLPEGLLRRDSGESIQEPAAFVIRFRRRFRIIGTADASGTNCRGGANPFVLLPSSVPFLNVFLKITPVSDVGTSYCFWKPLRPVFPVPPASPVNRKSAHNVQVRELVSRDYRGYGRHCSRNGKCNLFSHGPRQ